MDEIEIASRQRSYTTMFCELKVPTKRQIKLFKEHHCITFTNTHDIIKSIDDMTFYSHHSYPHDMCKFITDHKILTLEFYMIGFGISNGFGVGITPYNLIRIISNIDYIYKYNKMCNGCIYIALAYLMYEVLPFNYFTTRFLLADFNRGEYYLNLEMINGIQHRYKITCDPDLLDILKLVLYKRSDKCAKLVKQYSKKVVDDAYCYVSNQYIENIYIHCTTDPGTTHNSITRIHRLKLKEHNLTGIEKENYMIELAYIDIAKTTPNKTIYTRLASEYLKNPQDLDIIKLHKILTKEETINTMMVIIHRSKFKLYAFLDAKTKMN